MRDLSQLLPIYGVLLLAQLIFSWFNYTFLFSKIKTGVYQIQIPFTEVLFTFSSWSEFTAVAWLFNAPAYLVGTILVALSIKLSVDDFGVAYVWVIASQVVAIVTTIFFMWYKMGELPNRNGWIALMFVLLASIFSANSGKNI